MRETIYRADGTVARTSRNLRGFLRHTTHHAVAALRLTRRADGSGVLGATFTNGDHYTTTFADWSALVWWIAARRNLIGAPVELVRHDGRQMPFCLGLTSPRSDVRAATVRKATDPARSDVNGIA